jgi:DNA-binding CsgD family transcriptional regulator/tetratricopeptide (TPR) repeat protein
MELLEREGNLAELNAALAEASKGSGRIALVSGEAGIGKTSLVEQFTRGHRQAFRVLWGVCDSYFTPRPLGPLHDMAAQIQGSLPDLLGSDASRTAIFSAVLGELQRSPCMIVFEDVHWADEATLDLLRFLGRRIQHTPALLVMTYRDDELSLQHPLRSVLGDLASSSTTWRIQLPPLSEDAVRTLAGEVGPDPSALHRQTGGNPFFITEVLSSPTGGIPPTIRDAVLARAARLSLSGRAVLEAAAVIGLRVETWLLVETTGAEAQAAEECTAAGMLLPQGDELAFRHELARQTVLETISPHKRYVLHRLVLDALKSSPLTRSDVARLAHHAQGSGDREAVLEYAPAAARQASAAGAHREAMDLYALALRFVADLPPAEHALMLEAYSRECNLTERQIEGIIAFRKALNIWEELGNPLKQGEALASMAIMLRNNGDNREAEQASRAAIEILEAQPPGWELAHAYRVRATLRLSNREPAEAIEWGERAILFAERFGDEDVLGMAHVATGSAWLFLDYAHGCCYLDERLKIARAHGQERHIANLYAYLGSSSVELYELHRAERYLAEGIDYTADRDLDVFSRYLIAWLALAYIHLGRWSEADQMIKSCLQSPTFPAISRIAALAAAGCLLARRGDPGASIALDEALELATRTGTLQYLGLVRKARAEAAWLAGDDDTARAEARAAYDLAVQKRHPWFTGVLLFWRRRAGERVSAPDWIARPFALQIAGDWRAAAAEWERLGCPYEKARALEDGDSPAQITALEIFEQLGAGPAADRLRRKLHASGAPGLPRRPRASTRENPFSLTDRQVEILTLLIEGRSNAEIAARLHISPKTADHHVSAILSKLDVHSREDAAELARRHPHFKK